jgi:3-oxoadipate enol-lactonase
VGVAEASVEIAGDGPGAVVLVHAGVCDSRMWDPQWAPFAATRRVVRYDLRGFGRSPLPPEPYSHAADLVALLGRLGAGPVWLVGASLGGRVALEVAVAHPELVEGLVVAGAALSGHDWSEEMAAFGDREDAALGRGDLDAAVEENLRMWVDAGRPAGAVDQKVRAQVAEMQRLAFETQYPTPPDADEEPLVNSLANRVGEITVPVMAITGQADVADFQDIADRLVVEVAGARRATIPGAAHLPSMEQPEKFNRLALGFITERTGG